MNPKSDIDRRQKVEQALRVSEETFVKLFQASPVGIAVTRLSDGLYLEVNKTLANAIGYAREELLGRSTLELGLWADVEDRPRFLAAIEETGSVRDLELRFKSKDGRIIVSLLSGDVIEIGGERCFLSVIQDITQRRYVEELLTANEALFRVFIKHTPAAIAMFDNDMRYLQVSDRFLADYKLAGEDLIGRSHYEVFPNLPEKWKQVHRRVLAGAHEKCDEDEFITDDGSAGWIQWEALPWRKPGGDIGGLILMTQLVTDRKRAQHLLQASERKFAIAFNYSPVLTTISRLDNGQFLAVNESFLQVTGFSNEELIGKTALNLGLWIDPNDRIQVMQRLLEQGSVRDLEVRLRAKNGDVHVLLLSIGRIEVDGQPCLLHAGVDITERRRAEDDNRRLLHNLGERIKELTALHNASRILQRDELEFSEVLNEISLLLPLAFQYPSITACRVILGGIRIETPNFTTDFPILRTDFETRDGHAGSIEVVYFEPCPFEAEGPFSLEERALIDTLGDMIKAACDRRQAEALVKGQREVLEMIALGVPLNETLDVLLKLIENQAAGMKCSISTIDQDGLHLHHVSSPSLPAEFVTKFEGETIGEVASSSAAYVREPVVVTDIDVDERFEKYRELAHKHGLRACWSVPIFDPHQSVIGTLAVYYSEPQSPSPHHLRLIEVATNIAAVCISRKREEEALQASEVRYRTLFETSPNAVSVLDDRLRVLMTNERAAKLYGFDSTEEFIGLELLRFVALKDRARIKELLQTVRETGNLDVFECSGVRKDGTQFQLEIRATLLPNPEGKSPSLLTVKTDITKRKQAENALRNSEEQLRALTAKISSAREEEGTRIAREIHDELGGALTGLKWDLEGIESHLASENGQAEVSEVRKRITSMTGRIESTISTVRRISSELRPGVLDDLGLVAAIEWQGQQLQTRTGLNVHFDTELEMVEVNREGATAVFRIFQEVLTNILRHSQAQNIYVKLSDLENEIELEVRDDGRGITEREKRNTRSLGLLGMKERALLVGGSVAIRGNRGRGTTVTVRVPKNFEPT